MADLDLEVQPPRGDAVSVAVRGEVDLATVPQLLDMLNGLVDRGSTRIILDCRALTFLDSSGIGALVALRKRLGDDGSVVLEEPQPQVRKVLEITGVHEHVVIVP